MSHQVRRGRARWLPRLAVLTGILLAAPVVLSWVWWLPSPPSAARSAGTNALWLRHAWVGDPHAPGDYEALGRTLVQNQISDAFFHAGPIDADGRIPAQRYAYAAELVSALHEQAPGVHVQAYIGQLTTAGGGGLDLDGRGVRQNLLLTCEALIDEGFDGIHFDIEPLKPSAAELLDLLQAAHARTQARGRLLSISVGKLEPTGDSQVGEGLWRRLGSSSWVSGELLRTIADRVDQLALMAYDTPVPTEAMTGAVYAWETAHVLRLIGDRVTVFIGVPTYKEGHHLSGENLSTAIRGARRGLGDLGRPPSRAGGLAIFAEWTTTPREWKIWHDDWLAP
jgi:hypothetical protein